MAGRKTNLALLFLLGTAFATGVLAYAIGGAWVRWVVVAHGIAGLAIVALAPWKGAIARRGLRRPRPGRATSILLVVLVVASVITGIVHATGLVRVVGTFAPLGLHVGTSLAAIAVAVAHMFRRPVRPRAADLSRRTLVRAGGVVAGASVLFGSVEGALWLTGARGAHRRSTGSHEVGSFAPDAMPVTQWFDDSVPRVDVDRWRLRLVGPGHDRLIDRAELDRFSDGIRATLDCTGGWYAEQDWEGVRVDHLVHGAQGSSFVVRSATGFARRFPLADAPGLLLATRVAGQPLSAGHGAPLRLVAPGRRGFWWVKWITAIEVDDAPWWWQPPFPLT